MCTRMAPPARASSSQTGLVKPCGPHHCARWRGSVQSLKTSSRGASRMRVSVSSRGTAPLFFSVMFFLFLQVGQVVVEPIKTLIPKAAVLLDPGRDILQRFRLKPAGTPLRATAPGDEPDPLKDLQMFGDGGAADFEGAGQFADR